MGATLSLKNLTISYQRQPAVHHLSGEFPLSSLTAITGPNGAGKSTLLKSIAGILPYEGIIDFHGLTRDDIAYLPQAADLQRDFPLSVIQMVTSGYWKTSKGFGRITKQQRHDALHAIEAVGLRDFAHRTLDTLSAGQFQRALFARLIVQDAQLILLDEPFNAVDVNTTARLLDIMHGWHNEKRTVICVLHDLEQIRTHFPECLLMARECIAWGNSKDVLKPENLLGARFFREAPPHSHEVCPA